jgi:malate dehydrogenase (oxaloacetate-decarboxylating)(NADP+)
VRRREPGLEIDGEMQADTAVFAPLREEQFPWCDLGGPANVLVFPELQSANTSYKLIWRLAGAEAIGPILLGMARPVHVLQAGVEVTDVVNLATLCVVDAQEMSGREPPGIRTGSDDPSPSPGPRRSSASHDRGRGIRLQ